LGSRALAGDDRVAELGPLRFGARLGVAFAL
jgi:hypothetical protein